MDESRRSFLIAIAGAGALEILREAPSVPGHEQAAKPEPIVPGTVPNDVVKKEKASSMQWHSESPLTGSVPAHEHDFDVTPSDRMFVRNNLLTPDLDATTHRLTVKGLVERELSVPVEELKKAFPVVTLHAVLECAGSGRTGYQPTPRGTPWPPTGGMGCPKWTGVRLRDLLKAAGAKASAVHVAGQGGDFGAATAAPVIRSIPVAKAMEENTLVVWAMNDAPLPKVHGFPLRLLAPGWAGSASIKWLHTLAVLDAPFRGPYMDDSYRMPKHPVGVGERMPPDTVSTEAWPVKSLLTSPAPNARFRGGDRIAVRGKAWVGEATIARVEISTDEGATWKPAKLGPQGDRYAWRTFTFQFQPERLGYQTFLARAWDDKGNAQPMVPYPNPLGYFFNAVHRVDVVVER